MKRLANVLKFIFDKITVRFEQTESFWSHTPRGTETGDSLISVIIAFGIFGVLATGISKSMVDGFKATKSVSTRQDLETIRQTVLQRMDCRATLGVGITSSFPFPCSAAEIPILRKNGAEIGSTGGRIGDWIVTGSCINQELIIKARIATANTKDGLTGKAVDAISTNSTGVAVSVDLFGGTTDLCREYYDAQFTSCSSPAYRTTKSNEKYDLFRGTHDGEKLCCREVIGEANGPSISGVASCNADEWLMSGGSECTDYKPFTNPSFFHRSEPVGNSWETDCWGAVDFSEDRPARSQAICCPSAN